MSGATALSKLQDSTAAARLALAASKATVAKDDLTGAALAAGGGTKNPLQNPKPFKTHFQGIPIHVDRPKGFKQVGKGDGGTTWERTYLVDYGYVPGVKAILSKAVSDGEDLDVYLGPEHDAEDAHIILQVKADGTPDELKVMLGWKQADAARKMYLAHTPERFFGAMATMPVEMLKALLGLDILDANKALAGFAKALWSAAAVRKVAGVSFEEVNRLLREKLMQMYPPKEDGSVCGWGPYLVDTFDDALVYEYEGKLYRVSYALSQGSATIGAGAEHVIRTYVPADAGAKVARLKKALASTTAYVGDMRKLPEALKDHPATKAAPVETYDPDDVGGWKYVLEAKNESWVAFVDVNGRALLWTEREKSGGVVGLPYEFTRADLADATAKKHAPRDLRLIKKAATPVEVEERFVLGIVLEPEVVDAQGDIYSAEEIRLTAYEYAKNFRNVGLMHKGLVNGKVFVVQNWIAPVDMEIEGSKIKKGTWLLGLEVLDDELWGKVKGGDLTGLSIGGFAKRTPIAA